MSRRTVIAVIAVVVAVAVAAAAFVWWNGRIEAEVRRAVTRYDLALADALETLDPEAMGDAAGADERLRIANYVTLLYGRGVSLESSLLELEIVELGASESTVTAVVSERWRYLERDLESGEVRGDETVEDQVLRYVLVRQDGRLIVSEVSFVEGATDPLEREDAR